MSEPIKVGDLVVVVRGHSCDLGLTFTVTDIHSTWEGMWSCSKCTEHWYRPESMAATTGEWSSVELSNLKRIPPLEELGDVKQDEEITA